MSVSTTEAIAFTSLLMHMRMHKHTHMHMHTTDWVHKHTHKHKHKQIHTTTWVALRVPTTDAIALTSLWP